MPSKRRAGDDLVRGESYLRFCVYRIVARKERDSCLGEMIQWSG